jgi:hypothetical protein
MPSGAPWLPVRVTEPPDRSLKSWNVNFSAVGSSMARNARAMSLSWLGGADPGLLVVVIANMIFFLLLGMSFQGLLTFHGATATHRVQIAAIRRRRG